MEKACSWINQTKQKKQKRTRKQVVDILCDSHIKQNLETFYDKISMLQDYLDACQVVLCRKRFCEV